MGAVFETQTFYIVYRILIKTGIHLMMTIQQICIEFDFQSMMFLIEEASGNNWNSYNIIYSIIF